MKKTCWSAPAQDNDNVIIRIPFAAPCFSKRRSL